MKSLLLLDEALSVVSLNKRSSSASPRKVERGDPPNRWHPEVSLSAIDTSPERRGCLWIGVEMASYLLQQRMAGFALGAGASTALYLTTKVCRDT